MDSLSLFKGYGQLEDQSLHKPSPAKKHRLIAISAAILLVLVGAGAIAVEDPLESVFVRSLDLFASLIHTRVVEPSKEFFGGSLFA